MNHDSTEANALARFADLARGYCSWCEDISKGSDQDKIAARWLTQLYAAALSLPSNSRGVARPDPAVVDDELDRARNGLACFAPGIYVYIEPAIFTNREVLPGELASDLLEIYRHVKAGLLAHDAGNSGVAIGHWSTEFRSHWGRIATLGLHAIHELFISKLPALQGRYSKTFLAIRHFESAIAKNPNDGAAYCRLAFWWCYQGQYIRALDCYNTAIRLDPTHSSALCGRAALLATCPIAEYRDGARAVKDATAALRLAGEMGHLVNEWDHRRYIQTLAAAHAETGDFEEAVKIQASALAHCGTRTAEREVRRHLALLQRGKHLRIDGAWWVEDEDSP